MTFVHEKIKLARLLEQMGAALAPYGFESRITAAQERLGRATMNLLIVGEFSRGKSTFINALVGAPVLPSKVNPTTATINTIVPGAERSMQIWYHDGRVETADLPQTQVNKFLEQIVTVANSDAPKIKQVQLTLPGPMEKWSCTIVDTPGVNELDDAREEVTYHYLQRADACIVLLDAQPPLSESERRFIGDKVLGSDVNRLIYVINRMDEVEKFPDGPVAERLTGYTQGLLAEKFPMLESPAVFTVSAKEALRARYKREESPWLEAFERFEEQLHSLLSEQARKGRLPDHVDRAAGIVEEALLTASDRLALTQGSADELAVRVSKLEEEERYIRLQLQGLDDWFTHQAAALARRIRERMENGFSQLRAAWITQAEACADEADFAALKSAILTGIRREAAGLMEELGDSRRALAAELHKRFDAIRLSGQEGESAGSLPALRRATRSGPFQSDAMSETFFMQVQQADSDGLPVLGAVAAGGVLGYMGAALLGPIGLAAALVGSYVLGRKLGEERDRAAWEKARQEAIRTIRKQMDEVLQAARTNASRMAEEELQPMEQYYRDAAQMRIEAISRTLAEQREGMARAGEDLARHRMELESLMARLGEWRLELHNMKGALLA